MDIFVCKCRKTVCRFYGLLNWNNNSVILRAVHFLWAAGQDDSHGFHNNTNKATTVSCTLERNGKTVLAKAPRTPVLGYEEIKPELRWELPSCTLTLRMLEGAVQAAGGELSNVPTHVCTLCTVLTGQTRDAHG